MGSMRGDEHRHGRLRRKTSDVLFALFKNKKILNKKPGGKPGSQGLPGSKPYFRSGPPSLGWSTC